MERETLEITEQAYREAFGGKLPILRSRLYVTLGCNLNCPHCYVEAREPLPNELSINELYYTVDCLGEEGLLYLTITGGEPMLKSEETIQLAKYASSKGMIIRINTNGTLITDTIAKRLSGIPNLHVNVSLDGPNKDVHEKIRGKDTFTKVIQAIKILRKNNVRVAIASIGSKENICLIKDMVNLAVNLNVQELRFPVLIPLGRCKFEQKLLPPIEEYPKVGAVISQIALEVKSKLTVSMDLPPALFKKELLDEPRYEFLKYGCLVGLTRLDIYPDGSIFPCDGLRHIKVGNIRSIGGKLEELWENSRAIKFVRKVYGNLKGVCKKCVYKLVCNGHCRSFAYAIYSDLAAPNPICQKLFEEGLFPKECLV
jgi:radical SAM protein with 4Fe4S-binding SPASM domain